MSFDIPDDEKAEEIHENRITRCRACRAKIIFLLTATGKRMPVDADTVEVEDVEYDGERHISHFSTCPNAGTFRKPR